MSDFACFLAGMVRLLAPGVLVLLWHKKTGARLYPALLAFAVCLPAFIVGSAIRSGFSHDDAIAYYIKQGILFGIVEEGTKYLVLRFLLAAYDDRKDAVSYGIGHSAYELFASGITCIGLIGTGKAASGIFGIALLSVIEHPLWTAALTVLIFYGIRTEKTKIMLPAAMLLHAVCNASQGIFIESAARAINLVLLAGMCFAAYRCWKAMEDPYAMKL